MRVVRQAAVLAVWVLPLLIVLMAGCGGDTDVSCSQVDGQFTCSDKDNAPSPTEAADTAP